MPRVLVGPSLLPCDHVVDAPRLCMHMCAISENKCEMIATSQYYKTCVTCRVETGDDGLLGHRGPELCRAGARDF